MEYICIICQEHLETPNDTIPNDYKPVYIPCGHAFHKLCCENWIGMSKKCPLCNTIVQISDIKILYLSSSNDISLNVSTLEVIAKLAIMEHRDKKEELKKLIIANRKLTRERDYYKDRWSESDYFAIQSTASVAKSALLLAEYDIELTETKQEKDKLLRIIERQADELKRQKKLAKRKEKEAMVSKKKVVDELSIEIKKKNDELVHQFSQLTRTKNAFSSLNQRHLSLQQILEKERMKFNNQTYDTNLLRFHFHLMTDQRDTLKDVRRRISN